MTPEELEQVAQKRREKAARFEAEIRVCTAAGCLSMKSEALLESLQKELDATGRADRCRAKGVGCLGLCSAGPLVLVAPDDVLYQKAQPEDAAAIVASVGAEPLGRLRAPTDIPFFTRQTKIVLEHCGVIDPKEIDDYIAVGGYRALARALTEMSPAEVINEVMDSGLRGRGGAGYPTGLKWMTVAKAISDIKYVICNGDEGDPGAFMDRSILEGDPHRVIEGMAISAYAVGASKGYIYVRAEYPVAIDRLNRALRAARRMKLLGNAIFDTTFDFDVEVRLGAGAYVCGEETALIASIEGKRGTPRPRPPYPADYGLWGRPTLINNVETFANIAPILEKGGAWYAGFGTEKSKGTKVFALAGQLKNTGLVEVPMGMTLQEIIFDIGGGMVDGREFKAVQTGGPSGGCIPKEHLDTPLEYERLQELGSIMGSGGMIVLDNTSSMVDVARYFMEFSKDESCGKCIPCRVGTSQMYNLLSLFVEGKASAGDLRLLEELCDLVRHTSLCGLGQSAPNPVMSTLRYFREEYTNRMAPAHPTLTVPSGARTEASHGGDGAH
jgi:bidirectional [NiFe] hydrogenase diaphorase subunit